MLNCCDCQIYNTVKKVFYNEKTKEVLNENGDHLGYGYYNNDILIITLSIKSIEHVKPNEL